MKVKAVVFDLDGTLADTIPLIVASWNASVGRAKGKVYTRDEVVALFGIPDAAMIRREIGGRCREIVQAFHRYYEVHHDMVKPFEGVDVMLRRLHDKGVPMGIVTGKGSMTADTTVHKLGWDDFFETVVTGEDVENQKPDPEPAKLAAEDLGVACEECAFVGDSPADINCGKAAGMVTVAAGWHGQYLEQLKELAPAVWADKPGDVIKVVG